MTISEKQICNELVSKYPNLESYKTTSNRFKVQKKNISEILKIITDDSDKEKFKEFLSMYNSRKGKDIKKESEKDNFSRNNSSHDNSDEKENQDTSNNQDTSKNQDNLELIKNLKEECEKFKKQRDNVLKKISQLQNDYDDLEEKYENLGDIHNEFKMDYKEVCNERNKLELKIEGKGWKKDKLEEFDKYKSFYQKYIEFVDELDKIKN